MIQEDAPCGAGREHCELNGVMCQIICYLPWKWDEGEFLPPTGWCTVSVMNGPVHIIRESADLINAVLCGQTGPLSKGVAYALITSSFDVLLANVMLYWPMCCIRNRSADTHYTVISWFDKCGVMLTDWSVKWRGGRHVTRIIGLCAVGKGHTVLAYMLYTNRLTGKHYTGVSQFNKCGVMSTNRSVQWWIGWRAIHILGWFAVV